MKSVVIKRSVLINRCKTSISLEDEFWDGLREIAEHGKLGLSKLLEQIDQDRNNINLSSAIRVFVFRHFRALGKKTPSVEPAGCPGDNSALRARADEFRTLAAGFNDPQMRTIMFRVAADYELLAERLERPETEAGQHAEYP